MTKLTQANILLAAGFAIVILFPVAANLYSEYIDKERVSRYERNVELCLDGSSKAEDLKYCCERYSPGFTKALKCQGTFITRPDGSVIFVQ